jgi:hypothetical protein
MHYPRSPSPNSAEITIDHPSVINLTAAGWQLCQRDGPARLKLTLAYNRGTGTADDHELAALWGFLLWCRGQLRSFDVQLPVLDGHGDTIAGAVLASAAAVGADTLVITGLPVSTTVRRAGDLLQIGSSQRACMLAADLFSDASGHATATLCWPIDSAAVQGSAVVLSDITLRMRLDNSSAELTRQPGRLHSIKTISMIEVIDA